MKTFAYLALLGSAMAVRLMEEAPAAPVEDAATMKDLEGVTLDDLEAEQSGLGECFLEKTGEALAERSMGEEEIGEVKGDLVDGAEEGKTLGQAVEHLRAIGREAGVDTDGQDEFLADVLAKVKGCKQERKEKRGEKKDEMKDGDSGSEDEGTMSEGEATPAELAQEELADLAAAAGEELAAMDTDEREATAEAVKEHLQDMSVDESDVEAVKEAMKEGAEEKLREAFDKLPEEAQEKIKEGVEALKEHKREMEGDDDGEGSDDGEGPKRRPRKDGDKDEDEE